MNCYFEILGNDILCKNNRVASNKEWPDQCRQQGNDLKTVDTYKCIELVSEGTFPIDNIKRRVAQPIRLRVMPTRFIYRLQSRTQFYENVYFKSCGPKASGNNFLSDQVFLRPDFNAIEVTRTFPLANSFKT